MLDSDPLSAPTLKVKVPERLPCSPGDLQDTMTVSPSFQKPDGHIQPSEGHCKHLLSRWATDSTGQRFSHWAPVGHRLCSPSTPQCPQSSPRIACLSHPG